MRSLRNKNVNFFARQMFTVEFLLFETILYFIAKTRGNNSNSIVCVNLFETYIYIIITKKGVFYHASFKIPSNECLLNISNTKDFIVRVKLLNGKLK